MLGLFSFKKKERKNKKRNKKGKEKKGFVVTATSRV
jgi:hypothetical protein